MSGIERAPERVTVELVGGLPRNACAFVPRDPREREVIYVRADLHAGVVDLLREALHLNVQAALPPEWTERARRVVGPSGGGQ